MSLNVPSDGEGSTVSNPVALGIIATAFAWAPLSLHGLLVEQMGAFSILPISRAPTPLSVNSVQCVRWSVENSERQHQTEFCSFWNGCA